KLALDAPLDSESTRCQNATLSDSIACIGEYRHCPPIDLANLGAARESMSHIDVAYRHWRISTSKAGHTTRVGMTELANSKFAQRHYADAIVQYAFSRAPNPQDAFRRRGQRGSRFRWRSGSYIGDVDDSRR